MAKSKRKPTGKVHVPGHGWVQPNTKVARAWRAERAQNEVLSRYATKIEAAEVAELAKYNPTKELADILDLTYGPTGWYTTAGRFLNYLKEFVPGPKPTFTEFEFGANQLIVASPIEFASMCSHHLLPFLGYAHVGYISDGKVLGLSKIPRLVEWVAHRPQMQEAMTSQIADELKSLLKPKGVHVVVEAIHTCACARGVRKVGMYMRTSLPTGVFRDNAVTREEFFHMCSLQGGRSS